VLQAPPPPELHLLQELQVQEPKLIPSSEPPKKHKPAPFQRPRIELGAVKREWKWVLPSEVHKGDIVPDFGLIEDIIPRNSEGYVFIAGRGKSDYFDPDIRIWAFT
jgi:hypothetical protein